MSSTTPTAPTAPFIHRHRLRLSQTDAGGVVFFAQSLVIAHDAWEAVLDEVGFSVARIISEGTFALPIVEANTRLLRPMRGWPCGFTRWITRHFRPTFKPLWAGLALVCATSCCPRSSRWTMWCWLFKPLTPLVPSTCPFMP